MQRFVSEVHWLHSFSLAMISFLHVKVVEAEVLSVVVVLAL